MNMSMGIGVLFYNDLMYFICCTVSSPRAYDTLHRPLFVSGHTCLYWPFVLSFYYLVFGVFLQKRFTTLAQPLVRFEAMGQMYRSPQEEREEGGALFLLLLFVG